MSEPRYWAVVPAAGIGQRMGTAIPKQYLPLAGLSVIAHTLRILLIHRRISGVVVAINTTDQWWKHVHLDTDKPLLSVTGGEERCYSVINCLCTLQQLAQPDDWVLVHDAVRPCLRSSDLDRLIETLATDPVGGLLAVPVRDTIKRADADQRVSGTVERSGLWHALTPQMFRLTVLHLALQRALENQRLVTDEASAIELAGLAPRLVEGHGDNIKITRAEDLVLAEFFLSHSLS
jgi:2-C-methyl-D-erythritol 4-phosphate cytidylyltransferase